jgi:hypothetical protein
MILSFLCVAMCPAVVSRAQDFQQASEAQLQKWLEQYPNADADGDGRLTRKEAETFHREMVAREKARQPSGKISFRHEYTFATMSDGVKIALAIGYPHDCDPDDPQRKWPTIFSTCGYTFATFPMDPRRFGDRCVTVNVSLRGTGASGGQLQPWTPRSWKDGYEVIENWIAQQPWSNGRVGIVGHSWPGLMGFLTASTHPPSVKAVCVSGLCEDFYRGIGRIGGVPNCGFPMDWLNNYYHAEGPFGSGQAAMIARGLDTSAYRKIVEDRGKRDLTQDMLWMLLHEPLESREMVERSLREAADGIHSPILIGHQYQDEQTGPSGCWLFSQIPQSTPRRLVMTNGSHRTPPVLEKQMDHWLKHYLLEEANEVPIAPQKRVFCYFETCWNETRNHLLTNPPVVAEDFPIPETKWTYLYMRSANRLSLESPDATETPDVYRIGRGDVLEENEKLYYTLEIDEPVAICGPIVVNLWAKTSTLDTDFFVLLADLTPEGDLYGLQRGLLRASHRGVDEEESVFASLEGREMLVRPHHRHDRLRPISPGEAYCYRIEIFPVGHVFRPGHKLVLRVSRPPFNDPIGVTRSGQASYRYDSNRPPATVTILHDADHPSSLLLPVLPELPPLRDPPPRPERLFGLQVVESFTE